MDVKKKEELKKRLLITGCILFVCIMAVISYCIYKERVKFHAPGFETTSMSNASADLSNTVSNFGYIKSDYGFLTGICASPVLDNQELYVYLSNDSSNNVWLLLSVIDGDSQQEIVRTKLIKPGQYIDCITLSAKQRDKLSQCDSVTYKVYAYEPDTYYSEGAITLGNIQIQSDL